MLPIDVTNESGDDDGDSETEGDARPSTSVLASAADRATAVKKLVLENIRLSQERQKKEL